MLDAIRIGLGLVDLVDSHNNWHTSRFGVGDGFLGLRHHAVIGGHDQDHNVGCLGTTRTHGGKRLVTRGVKKGNHATLGFNVISTNMLRNAACFAGCHLGATDVVKQRGLTMVHVTHDGHDGSAWQ